ncbi:DUF3280 domain-containing protein [Salipiger thiooxidans]|uniref:DUF3280 domain-containing protein n=1 Tax=Salipiger thiooxidans TaxID=282683 RepID=UPI001CD1B9D3|nr:DUF3280 domain-containing protein [Salipiger thiooxidans]MCA0848735.1 DUF3280 domain-containing protein [Salipiger thiooxidans]
MLSRATLLILALSGPATAGETVAFFGITFLDSSLQTAELGQDPAEIARIAMLEELVRTRFTAEGYEFADLEPVATERDRIVNPAKCYGCDTRMATKLGADYSLVGEVQKVSNLIVTMNLQMRSAETGDMVKGRVVDIRSNTDESWRRGMTYILDNTFFKEEEE